ncbi:glycyl-radical enzyme activating protein [Flammeovirga aprica]|uniref:Glycyl-radical enzyme activating protein n=1 Tax=Flammeovirga aprica JL-4 TaxID=694437 RepID=A0A7X9P130_9BACT|nr:glycyl-radical enzyme activating protein [Flammeovirga aprica]NME67495.1 glycyl-radical enzyme activating protein [Flammeovirga aprica JL-4]
MEQGIITNLQRLSLHDGNGIRTVIFLKGCNMSCLWCHNPETFSSKIQIERVEQKCISCGACVEVCSTDALFVNDGKVHYNPSLCDNHRNCTQVCYSGAMHEVGKTYSPQGLYKAIEKDIPFFKSSNGGITFSGGEPLLQHQFLLQTLKYFKERGLNIAVESNFNVSWSIISKVLPYVDHWLIDLKFVDAAKHKQWTSTGNQKVLSNIKRIDQEKVSYELRTPLIPTANNNKEEITAINDFVHQLSNCKDFKLNPYHKLGEQKYKNLGLEYNLAHINEMNHSEFKFWSDLIKK